MTKKYSQTALPERLKKILHKRASGDPQLSELLTHFYEIAGGPRAVAKIIHEELNKCKNDARLRAQLLRLILFSTKQLNALQGTKDDLGLLSEDDLEKLGSVMIQRIQAREPVLDPEAKDGQTQSQP
jgi:hypothetical protein